MKFLIRTVWHEYAPAILEKYPVLKTMPKVVEENGMLFLLCTSVKQLLEFVRALEEEVIISDDKEGWGLEIYDDYRE